MNARKYLLQLRTLALDIKRVRETIEAIDNRMRHLGSMRYDVPRVQSSGSGGVESDLDRKEKALQKLHDLEAEYIEKYTTIMKQLDGIEDPLQREVLKRYYADGKSMKEISLRMHYSQDWVYHIFSDGQRAFSDKFLKDILESR